MILFCKKFCFIKSSIQASIIPGSNKQFVLEIICTPCKYSLNDIMDEKTWKDIGIQKYKINKRQNGKLCILFTANMKMMQNFSYITVPNIEFNSQDEYNLWLAVQ